MLASLENVIEWAIKNKRGKAFRNYPDYAIAREIAAAFRNGGLVVDLDEQGNICGIMIAEHRLYIKQILSTKKGTLKNLVTRMKFLFPGLSWFATRHDRIKVYDRINYGIERCGVEMKGAA